MIVCQMCGYKNLDGSNFCESCGTKLEEKVMSKFCPTCGMAVEPDDNFCVACGSAIQKIEVIPEPEVEVTPEPEVEVTPEPAKKDKKGVGIAAAVIILVVALLGSLLGNGNSSDATVSEVDSQNHGNIIAEIADEVKEGSRKDLTEDEYQDICEDIMNLSTANNSSYEDVARAMAQVMVQSKIVSVNSDYRMKDISADNIERLVYGIAEYCGSAGENNALFEDGSLKNYWDELKNSGYEESELYSFIFDKDEFLELISAFYEDIRTEQFIDNEHAYRDYGDYIGVMAADGDEWQYFLSCDIKENDEYILIHAACYTGNNIGGGNIYSHSVKVLFEKTKSSVLGLQAVYVEGYENNISDYVLTCTASSELPNYNRKTYTAINLVDRDYSTPWVENAAGVGVGESVQLKLDGERWVQDVVLCNGYQESQNLLDMNGYVTKISIDFGNGVVHEFDCEKYDYADDLDEMCFDVLSLQRPVYTDTITITILDANSGYKYSDTCISEIELH